MKSGLERSIHPQIVSKSFRSVPADQTFFPNKKTDQPDAFFSPATALPAANTAEGVDPQAAPAIQVSPQSGGAIVQRKMGDGHDLTSPRFAGDAKLEACFDDESRLSIGAQGASVQKVQQALIDLGLNLGPSGADGSYGNFTWNAVKKFKADQKLGFENMGDVGPGTMKRLDSLLGVKEVAPPAVGEDGNGESCPNDDDLFLAFDNKPALASSFIATQTTSKINAVTGPGAATAHVSIDDSVKKFKEKVNIQGGTPEANISVRGQFFWGNQMWNTVTAELDRMAGEPTAVEFVNKAKATRDVIWSRGNPALLIGELAGIAAKSKSPEKPAMLALLKAHPVSGGAVEGVLWAALNKRPDDTAPTPELTSFRSLLTLRALVKFDVQGCGFHAAFIAERLKKKGGIKPLDAKAVKFPGAVIATGRGIQDRRPMGTPSSTFGAAATAAVDPASSFQLGDHIFQGGVASTVAKMKLALDAGQLISARVLSGDGQGGNFAKPDLKASPAPIDVSLAGEHSILIIGYDGNKFVFSDPDASVSSKPEAGFGLLFHSSGDDRLSTAESPGDMPIKEGHHRNNQHRYQILSLSPA